MNARPADALDACPTCGNWVRCGDSWRPTPAGRVHATCPKPTVIGTDKVRLHTRARTIPGRRA